MAEKMKTSWNPVSIDDVARYFVNGFAMNEGETLHGYDYFFDATKGVFVFRLEVKVTEGQTDA